MPGEYLAHDLRVRLAVKADSIRAIQECELLGQSTTESPASGSVAVNQGAINIEENDAHGGDYSTGVSPHYA